MVICLLWDSKDHSVRKDSCGMHNLFVFSTWSQKDCRFYKQLDKFYDKHTILFRTVERPDIVEPTSGFNTYIGKLSVPDVFDERYGLPSQGTDDNAYMLVILLPSDQLLVSGIFLS